MIIIPTHVDVLLPRRPYANYILMGIITVLSTIYILGGMSIEVRDHFVARSFKQPEALFLSVFLHMDFFHFLLFQGAYAYSLIVLSTKFIK